MIFGLANVAGSLAYADRDLFMTIGGVIVGSAWFAFGKYGGLPLAGTVANWRPPSGSDAVDERHRRGLLAIRRRKWATWAAIPVALAAMPLLMPSVMRIGHPELIALVVGVPLGAVNLRYLLSRCPRCGFGFFARSTSRAALLWQTRTCAHCGLSIDALKRQAPPTP
jgi:hypothetical protein